MKPMPGVMIEDMGHKISLNGVDNARLMFNNVRIKREDMLNRLADITCLGNIWREYATCDILGTISHLNLTL